MLLYVAGPMTGIEEFNFPAFRAATAQLEAAGFDVLDPSRHGGSGGPGYDWRDYMRLGLRDVLDADGVAVLPRWTKSRGANLEVQVAQTLGMPVRSVEEWLRKAAREKARDGARDGTERRRA